jgi:hypothetical protein
VLKLKTIALLMLAGTSIGCANVTVRRVAAGDFETKGVRYWLSAPYLLVKAPVEVHRRTELYELDRKSRQLLKLCPDARCSPGVPAGAHVVGPGGLPPLSVRGELILPSRGAAPQDVGGAARAAKAAGDPAPEKAQGTKAPAKEAPSKEVPAKEAASKEVDAKPPSSDAISVAWLPDYCEQYAIDSTNVLASQTLKIKLTNGWQLDGIDAVSNSTEIFGKLLDTIGAIASAALGAGGAVGEIGAAAEAAASGAESGKKVILQRTVTHFIKPGIYPLFTRDKGACSVAPTFSFSALQYELGESWVEVVLSDSKATPEPGK